MIRGITFARWHPATGCHLAKVKHEVYSRCMPSKNIIKQYGAGEYYHVYNRGVAKMDIFREEADYTYMLHLLKRHLSSDVTYDKFGREIPNYSDKIDLVAFCLMPNHYHFMVYLKDAQGLVLLMRSVMTSYSMYFNKKYKRVGGLFQNHFLAVRVTSDEYFWHVSSYIHLNPVDIGRDYRLYSFSSWPYFTDEKDAEWVHEEHFVLDDESRADYAEFVAGYEDRRKELNEMKHLLAHS